MDIVRHTARLNAQVMPWNLLVQRASEIWVRDGGKTMRWVCRERQYSFYIVESDCTAPLLLVYLSYPSMITSDEADCARTMINLIR
jgi:hypothetical protein